MRFKCLLALVGLLALACDSGGRRLRAAGGRGGGGGGGRGGGVQAAGGRRAGRVGRRHSVVGPYGGGG